MAFIPNIHALKKISDIHIDSLFISQAGNQIFNCSAESIPDFAEICEAFKRSLDTVIEVAQNLKSMVPEAKSK